MQRESLPGCCILLSLLLEVIIVTHYDSNAIKFGISTFGLQNQQQSCTPTVTVTQPSTATAAKHYHQTVDQNFERIILQFQNSSKTFGIQVNSKYLGLTN
jgi:hypothetical protein